MNCGVLGPRWCAWSLFGVASVLVLSGCGKTVTEDECTQLLDHYTDKVIEQARPSTRQGERRQLMERTRKAAALDPEFAECSSRVSRRAFECAMAAHNADQIERCLL